MSYDLRFAHRESPGSLAEASFLSYFEGRRGYTLNGMQAWYGNEDTGVYFSFEYDPQTEPPEDWADSADEDELPPQWEPSVASFEMNYNRPSFFVLEAAPEIAGFVDAFDLIVDDPQIDGMGRGGFSEERFISGWSKTNEWACSAVRQNAGAEAPLAYPRAHLLAIWKWNLTRTERQQQVGPQTFVPRISFASRDGQVRSFAIWPDAIPALLPRVDEVLIVRDQLARRTWYGRKKTETVVAPWNAIDAALEGTQRSSEPLLQIHPGYVDPPAHVLALVRRDWPVALPESFRVVAPDGVLDAEFFSGGRNE